MRSISVISAARSAARSRVSDLTEEQLAIDAKCRAEGREPSQGELDRLSRLANGTDKAKAELDKLDDEARDAIRAAMANPANLVDAVPSVNASRPLVGLRASAARTLDRLVSAGSLPAAAAARIEHVVRSEPLEAHSRYLAAVGDPDYLDAFAAVVASDRHAGFELTDRGRNALREARTAAHGLELMALGSDPGGIGGTGYPLPLEIDPTLVITGDGATNPLRRLATVKTIFGKQIGVVTVAQVTAAYGAEGSDVTAVSPAPADVQVKAERGTAFVRLTYELVADLRGATAEITRLFADARDNLESQKFAVGDGSDEPEGIVTGLTPFDATPTTVADFVAAQNDLGARYQQNARWLMDIASMNVVAQLVAEADASNAKIVDAQGRLLRKPMDEVSYLGDSIIYGDIAAGFTIVDRLGMSVEATGPTFNIATGVPDGSRGFLAIWRSGSAVVDDSALRLLGAS